jgi:hypothetical protein
MGPGLWWLCCAGAGVDANAAEWKRTVEKLDDRYNVTCCGRWITRPMLPLNRSLSAVWRIES